MNIAFRTDASIDIGTGHVMRCLTLANALRKQGATCTFICRAHEGHLAERIRADRHEIRLLPRSNGQSLPANPSLYEQWLGCSWQQDAEATRNALEKGNNDWLVVDHYALDARWESALRDKATRILAIDDLANRSHDCDVILDQNLGRDAQDYDGLVPDHAQRLIGPTYALLRPEFAEWRKYSLARRENPKLDQILITMGGADKDNATGKVLDSLRDAALPKGCQIVVVMGAHAPWLEAVRSQAAAFPGSCELRINVSNMAELMANSDLAIGAAGSTSWERCCLGLPSITVVLAENQRSIATALYEIGAVITLPDEGCRKQIPKCFEDAVLIQKLGALSNVSRRLVDGNGTHKLANEMESTE